uniref:Sialin n=1 Tax=Plectus sambesii TaxID=2011161 RepID=A0A914UMH7_9BILA
MAIKQSDVPFWTSARFGMAVLVFFGFANLYSLRVDLSVAVVCMVNHTWAQEQEQPTNSTTDTFDKSCGQKLNETKPDDGSFQWTKKSQGLILGSFFWGYAVLQLPGGLLAERFGAKEVFLVNMTIVSICTLLSPLAANVHYALLIALRVIIGLGEAVAFPSMHSLWARWAPPLERSKLAGFSYAGCQFGTVIALPISGFLCSWLGWSSIFYVFGCLGLIWCALFWLLAASSPQEHKRISAVERDYIVQALAGQLEATAADKKNRTIPWMKFLTSLPLWAILVTHVCMNFGNYLILTDLPTFMSDVLNFDIKANGLLSAIPYLSVWIVNNIAGFSADFLRSRKLLNTTHTRKVFMIIAMFGQSFCLVGAGYCTCEQRYLAVALITIGQGLSGFQVAGFLINHMDIAPRFAGTLFGLTNTIATIPGMVAPIVASAMTPNNTRSEWLSVFWASTGILCFGAIFYTVFGSGELQDWAKVEEAESEKQSSDDNISTLNTKC